MQFHDTISLMPWNDDCHKQEFFCRGKVSYCGVFLVEDWQIDTVSNAVMHPPFNAAAVHNNTGNMRASTGDYDDALGHYGFALHTFESQGLGEFQRNASH